MCTHLVGPNLLSGRSSWSVDLLLWVVGQYFYEQYAKEKAASKQKANQLKKEAKNKNTNTPQKAKHNETNTPQKAKNKETNTPPKEL